MIFINAVSKETVFPRDYAEGFLKLLNPIAPCVTEELWEMLGHNNTISYEPWPSFEESKLVKNEIEIPIQVNGKLRAKITVPTTATKEEIEEQAKIAVKDYIQNGIKKIVYIPNRIFNIVIESFC